MKNPEKIQQRGSKQQTLVWDRMLQPAKLIEFLLIASELGFIINRNFILRIHMQKNIPNRREQSGKFPLLDVE